jgi:hypothetical protein
VRLDDRGVRGLAQDLEQVVVADEVEPGEGGSLLAEEVVERALAPGQLVLDLVERSAEGVPLKVHKKMRSLKLFYF